MRERRPVLECVINVSEGRNDALCSALADAADRHGCLLDFHSDPSHNRSVFTLAGSPPGVQAAARALAAEAVRLIDLRTHEGVHPRLGAVDVVPFVALDGSQAGDPIADRIAGAIAARDEFATWAAEALGVPCFLYGPERTLPAVREHAFRDLPPDTGPLRPHPTAGAMCVGARPVLVAYNLWLAPGTPLELARTIAASIRTPSVRALGLAVGGQSQVSCNLIDPLVVGPAEVYDLVSGPAPVDRAELVGLVPQAVLDRIPAERWPALDLAPDRTIEARLADTNLRPRRRSPAGDRSIAGGGGGAAPAR